MKKLIAAIAAAFMFTLGLVAISEAPATAACPYSACINTTTTVKAPGRVRKAPRAVPIKVSVTAPGNAVPTGNVTVTVTKNGHMKYSSTQAYVGGTLTFVTQSLRKGTYSVTAAFTPPTGSVYNPSSASTTFTLKKRHHRHH